MHETNNINWRNTLRMCNNHCVSTARTPLLVTLYVNYLSCFPAALLAVLYAFNLDHFHRLDICLSFLCRNKLKRHRQVQYQVHCQSSSMLQILLSKAPPFAAPIEKPNISAIQYCFYRQPFSSYSCVATSQRD